MQLDADGFFHLAYCTNIHPGESWAEVKANVERYVPPLRAQLAPDRPFGVGLRLSDRAARELLEGGTLPGFRAWLHREGLYVFAFNGFPYGSFHRQRVKDQVYAPDWRTRDRVAYTLRLTDLLAALLPDGLDGGISTSPLSYKPWLDAAAREETFRASSLHLAEVAAAMRLVRERTGQVLHLDIEPEPDCLLENAEETVRFFRDRLLPVGAPFLADRLGLSTEEAERCLLDHIRICYDSCHFAVEYEAPADVFARLDAAGIRIGRVQISAALRVPLPDDPEARRLQAERLRPFVDAVYLHQTVERRADGRLRRYPDLDAALPHVTDPDAREWRTHFHVPIFVADYDGLHSTRPDIPAALAAARAARDCRHLEIETYTWEVLPPGIKLDLPASIRREYEWLLEEWGSGSGDRDSGRTR